MFQDQNGQGHVFITKTDGTGFVDLSPQGATQSWISVVTADGLKAWGNFTDQSGDLHAFLTKTDGTGFVDLTPKNTINLNVHNITKDGKLYGTYQTADLKWHGLIVPT